jgi:hypothetical protein
MTVWNKLKIPYVKLNHIKVCWPIKLLCKELLGDGTVIATAPGIVAVPIFAVFTDTNPNTWPWSRIPCLHIPLIGS